MSKIYGRIPVTKRELELLRSAVNESRKVVFERYGIAIKRVPIDPDEKQFYATRVDEYGVLGEKLNKPFLDDKSQDADPDDDDDEEEE